MFALISPAAAYFYSIPTVIFSVLIPIAGITIFLYFLSVRITPLLRSSPDPRLDDFSTRIFRMLKFAVFQFIQPVYPVAGVLRILIFGGFFILGNPIYNIT